MPVQSLSKPDLRCHKCRARNGVAAEHAQATARSRRLARASHLASGWLVFAFGALFPVLGWFVILPWVSLSGLGSVLVGMLPARRAPEPVKDIDFGEK